MNYTYKRDKWYLCEIEYNQLLCYYAVQNKIIILVEACSYSFSPTVNGSFELCLVLHATAQVLQNSISL